MKPLGLILGCSVLLAGAGADAANPSPEYKLYKLSELMLMPGTTPKEGPEWSTSLGDYKKRNISVYFGACLESRQERKYDINGHVLASTEVYFKHMIFFPPQSSEGTYVVGATGPRGIPDVPVRVFDTNGGRISIKPQAEITGIGQGGPAEWAIFKINAEYLLREHLLKLVQPNDFVAAVDAPAKIACPNTDDYDAGDLDKYYKAQGWTGPTPLPGR